MNKKFINVRSSKKSPNWIQQISRQEHLYKRKGDLRSEFERDYTRIIHSKGYRRMKHKTQVFFATQHDHICTRSEHVMHVASISNVIAKNMGLNQELANAISNAHDIGHPPFGHHGEIVLDEICKELNISEGFWHEKNSLFFVDNIETLKNPKGNQKNLNLTYAVRDGIICHCGEVNENAIFPREEAIDLYNIQSAGKISPYTWEACIVKIADKIAYIGRDIEDALLYKIIDHDKYNILKKILRACLGKKKDISLIEISNTLLINSLTLDLCTNSSPEKGIVLSSKYLELMDKLKDFNINNIYKYWRIEKFKDYATLIIKTIFSSLDDFYLLWADKKALKNVRNNFPVLFKYFKNWLIKYSNLDTKKKETIKMFNNIVYKINDKKSYRNSIIGFISSMSDNFAIKAFNEIISF